VREIGGSVKLGSVDDIDSVLTQSFSIETQRALRNLNFQKRRRHATQQKARWPEKKPDFPWAGLLELVRTNSSDFGLWRRQARLPPRAHPAWLRLLALLGPTGGHPAHWLQRTVRQTMNNLSAAVSAYNHELYVDRLPPPASEAESDAGVVVSNQLLRRIPARQQQTEHGYGGHPGLVTPCSEASAQLPRPCRSAPASPPAEPTSGCGGTSAKDAAAAASAVSDDPAHPRRVNIRCNDTAISRALRPGGVVQPRLLLSRAVPQQLAPVLGHAHANAGGSTAPRAPPQRGRGWGGRGWGICSGRGRTDRGRQRPFWATVPGTHPIGGAWSSGRGRGGQSAEESGPARFAVRGGVKRSANGRVLTRPARK
jgi:hypothetical protein